MNQPRDELLQRYDEANQQDASRPSAQLRAAILAQASQLAATRDTGMKVVGHPQRKAANAPRWQITVLGSVAALGLVGLLFIEFYRGDAQEREVAFGTGRPPLTQPAPAATVAATPAAETTPAPVPPAAPATARRSTSRSPGESVPDVRTAQALPQAPGPETAPAPAAAPAARPAPAPVPAAKMAADAAGETRTASNASREVAAGSLSASGLRSAAPATLAETRRASGAAGAAGGTSLLQAAQADDLARVNALLDQGVALDERDGAGRTPLMLAVLHGREAIVRRLLAAGADTAAVDRNGMTALQHAQALGASDMAALLEAARARRP